MTCLHTEKIFSVRLARPSDTAVLARTLRKADKRELRASHAGKSYGENLRAFYAQSAECLAVMLGGELGALCGVVPAPMPETGGGNGARTTTQKTAQNPAHCAQKTAQKSACVWLLTSGAVDKKPKAFYRACRWCLRYFWARYDVLFNFADERYKAAFRLVAHLGGDVSDTFIRLGATRFILVSLRRKNMGGITTSALQTSRAVSVSGKSAGAQARKYAEAAASYDEQVLQRQRAGEREIAYLFESGAEKTRRLYQQARERAASMRASFAGSGLNAASATLDTLLAQNRLQTQLSHAEAQDNLQAELSIKEQTLDDEIRTLREQGSYYRALSQKKGRLARWGEALGALLK